MVAAHKQCRGAKRSGVALRPEPEVLDVPFSPRFASCKGGSAASCPTHGLVKRSKAEMTALKERATRLREMTIDYIPHDSFTETDEPVAPVIPDSAKTKKTKRPAGATGYLAALYEVPLLAPDEEAFAFRRMNWLKHKADLLRRQIDPEKPCESLLDEIDSLVDRAVDARDQIVRANLRLVVSIAKNYLESDLSFDDLVSDGNMALLRAVEKFDFSRGFRFSTYATWAIRRLFYRAMGTQRTQKTRFISGDEQLFDLTPDDRETLAETTAAVRLGNEMHGILDRLEGREKAIIADRYGLNDEGQPQTLAEIGRRLGVSKERVRQLEARALKKLREYAEDARIAPPEE